MPDGISADPACGMWIVFRAARSSVRDRSSWGWVPPRLLARPTADVVAIPGAPSRVRRPCDCRSRGGLHAFAEGQEPGGCDWLVWTLDQRWHGLSDGLVQGQADRSRE